VTSSNSNPVDLIIQYENISSLTIMSDSTSELRHYLNTLSYLPHAERTDHKIMSASFEKNVPWDELVITINNSVSMHVVTLPIPVKPLEVDCIIQAPSELFIRDRDGRDLAEIKLISEDKNKLISLQINSKMDGSVSLSLWGALKSGVEYLESNTIESTTLLLTGSIGNVQRALKLLDYRPPTSHLCTLGGGDSGHSDIHS